MKAFSARCRRWEVIKDDPPVQMPPVSDFDSRGVLPLPVSPKPGDNMAMATTFGEFNQSGSDPFSSFKRDVSEMSQRQLDGSQNMSFGRPRPEPSGDRRHEHLKSGLVLFWATFAFSFIFAQIAFRCLEDDPSLRRFPRIFGMRTDSSPV